MTIDVEVTPTPDYDATIDPPADDTPDYVYNKQGEIWDRYTTHMQAIMPAARNVLFARLLREIYDGLDTVGLGATQAATLACVVTVLDYVEAKLYWLQTASSAEITAYVVATDPNWPTCS